MKASSHLQEAAAQPVHAAVPCGLRVAVLEVDRIVATLRETLLVAG